MLSGYDTFKFTRVEFNTEECTWPKGFNGGIVLDFFKTRHTIFRSTVLVHRIISEVAVLRDKHWGNLFVPCPKFQTNTGMWVLFHLFVHHLIHPRSQSDGGAQSKLTVVFPIYRRLEIECSRVQLIVLREWKRGMKDLKYASSEYEHNNASAQNSESDQPTSTV